MRLKIAHICLGVQVYYKGVLYVGDMLNFTYYGILKKMRNTEKVRM